MTGPLRHTSVSDVAVLRRLPGWGAVAATPLRGHGLAVRTTDLDLSGGVTLQIGHSTPLALLGSVPAPDAWLLLPLGAVGTLRIRGALAVPFAFAAFGSGAEYEIADPCTFGWARVRLGAPDAEALLWPPPHSPIRSSGRAAAMRADPIAWLRAAALVRDVEEVLAVSPEVFEVEAARCSLRASVIEASRELLSRPSDGGAPPRLRAAGPAERRILRAAEAWIRANPRAAADPARIAAAVGVREARLQAAFRDVLGVTPARYALRCRLIAAHAALHAGASPGAGGLDAVALGCGFWSVARFRRAYVAMFGAPPPRMAGPDPPDRLGLDGQQAAAPAWRAADPASCPG